MKAIEKIKAEIERLKNELIQEVEKGYKSEFDEGRISAFEDMIIYIDSLEEEPVSNDLEEELDKYFSRFKGLKKCYWNWRIDSINIHAQGIYDFAKHFAQWQKEQLMKDAVDGIVFTKLDDGSIEVRTHYFKSDKIDYLDEVKLIIIKEE